MPAGRQSEFLNLPAGLPLRSSELSLDSLDRHVLWPAAFELGVAHATLAENNTSAHCGAGCRRGVHSDIGTSRARSAVEVAHCFSKSATNVLLTGGF